MIPRSKDVNYTEIKKGLKMNKYEQQTPILKSQISPHKLQKDMIEMMNSNLKSDGHVNNSQS